MLANYHCQQAHPQWTILISYIHSGSILKKKKKKLQEELIFSQNERCCQKTEREERLFSPDCDAQMPGLHNN